MDDVQRRRVERLCSPWDALRRYAELTVRHCLEPDGPPEPEGPRDVECEDVTIKLLPGDDQ